MKMKSTKRALLMSALSLLLCCSMLIGTTFAWFTDTVESGINKITAGNLDVELYYGKEATPEDEKVTNTTANLFTDVNNNAILWEPGAVAYTNLNVVNAGTLAMKYNFAINFDNENYIEQNMARLSGVLKVAFLDKAVPADYTREQILDLAKTEGVNLINLMKAGNLEAGQNKVYGVVIYWEPSDLDNNWNVFNGRTTSDGEALHIDLGIKLVATQYTYESDSFGSDYDERAPWTGTADTKWYDEATAGTTEFTLTTAEELAGLAQIVNTGKDSFAGKSVKLGANIDLNSVAWTPIGTAQNNFGGSFDGNDYTIYNLYVTGTNGVGLIGFAGNAAHIEDVKIVGAKVYGNHWVGAVLGYGYLAANTLKDCHVEDAYVICTPVFADGVYDDGDKVGAVAGMAINGNITDNTAKNCVVMGYRDVGGIVGLAQAENRNISVNGNAVTGLTMVYAGAPGADYNGKDNQNMDFYVGRQNNHGGFEVTVNGNYRPDGTCFKTVATVVAEAAELESVLNKGGNVVLVADMEVSEPIEIAKNTKATLYLNGKKISGATTGAMLVNEGTLTVMGGTIENTTMNGGATISNKGTLILEDGANIVGAPIADGGYPAYCIQNAANLTIEDGASVSADRGCLYLSGTGETVINGGVLTNNDIGNLTFTSHVLVIGYGANNKLIINDGTFQHLHTTTSGGVVINNWSAVTVEINGGNFSGGNYFGKWDNLSDYGYGSTKTPFSVKGGSFTGMDSKFIAAGFKAVEKDGVYYVVTEEIESVVSSGKELDNALNSGEDVALSGDMKFNASETAANSGYGATGVSVKGNTLDGNGNSLGINNWATWDAAVHTTGGTIKNLTINSGMRGIFMGSATGDVYIDNVIIDGTIYTFNSDGGSKDYGVYISNSTLNGWTSFSNVHKEVVFTNCNFGEGNGYAFCRPYNSAKFVNCVFEEGFEFDTSESTKILFVNCYYGDTLITEENALNLGYGDTKFFYNGKGGLQFPVKTSDATEMKNALEEDGCVVLSGTVDLGGAAGAQLVLKDDASITGGAIKGTGWTGELNVGVQITSGNVVFDGVTFDTTDWTTVGWANWGMSVNVSGNANVTFKNCTFKGNQCPIYQYGADAVVTLENCTFTGGYIQCEIYSGDFQLGQDLIVKNCDFTGLADVLHIYDYDKNPSSEAIAQYLTDNGNIFTGVCKQTCK